MFLKDQINSHVLTHDSWLMKAIILEMENQSSQNRQGLKFADVMIGSDIEARMYRAQIETWVILMPLEAQLSTSHFKSTSFEGFKRLWKISRSSTKSIRGEMMRFRRNRMRWVISNVTFESYFMTHESWIMKFLGVETIGWRGEVVEKIHEVISLP